MGDAFGTALYASGAVLVLSFTAAPELTYDHPIVTSLEMLIAGIGAYYICRDKPVKSTRGYDKSNCPHKTYCGIDYCGNCTYWKKDDKP